MDGISRQLFLHLFVMKNQTKKQMFDWYDSPPAPRTDRRHKRQCIFEHLPVDSETLKDGVLRAKEVHEEVPPFFVAGRVSNFLLWSSQDRHVPLLDSLEPFFQKSQSVGHDPNDQTDA